ncbi:MAG: TlpA family protein disulfide reductase [Verrucomicrobiaceae bacterium]|jgi:hypothetical protein
MAHADHESTMIEKLTSAKTEEALNAVADEAKKEGLPREMVVEAKLVFGMQTQNTPLFVALLPELEAAALELKPFNITEAGFNVEYRDTDLTAEKKRTEHQITIPWLVEGKDRTLSRQLEVTSLPRALLITQQGAHHLPRPSPGRQSVEGLEACGTDPSTHEVAAKVARG